MATIRNSNQFGAVDRSDLERFQQEYGIRIPQEFREFLLNHNGGQPEPAFFWIIEGRDGSAVNQIYGLHDGPYPLSIHTYAGSERYGIPKTMLKIGDDGIGNPLCIGITAENEGRVYFIEHEIHPFEDAPNSPEGVIEIADSFEEFLGMLRDGPESECGYS